LRMRRHERRDALFAALTWCGIAFAYAAARIAVMGVDGASALSMLNDATLWQRVMTIPKLIITYLRLLALPHSLHMEYLFVETSFMSPYVLAGIPFLGAVAYLILKYIKPFSLSLFFLAWFVIGLAPFYNIFPVLSASLREHWLYLSGIAFFALFSLAASQALGSRNAYARLAAITLIIILIPYYAYATIARNRDWKDPITLYSHDLRYEPKSFLLHNNVGVEYFREGDMAAAKKHFLDAIKSSPGEAYDVAHNNLGAVLEAEGDLEGAIAAYQHSILLGGYNMAYANLGNAYLKQGDAKKALEVLAEGTSRYPASAQIRHYLDIARQRQ
ncbi:MAG: hypothetical protein Q8P78_02070, partial [bacterium]|nr:hypothetical protein [bacterium]